MSYPALAIAKWLASEGVGAFAGPLQWALHANLEPDGDETHDDIITVFDTGGGEPDTDQLDLTSPSFQVKIRCVKYSEGYAKHEAIRDLLIQASPIVSEGVTFILVQMTSDVLPLGLDDSNRHQLTANYRTIRQL